MVNTTDKAVEIGATQLAGGLISREVLTQEVDNTLSPYARAAAAEARKIAEGPQEQDPLRGLRRKEKIPNFNQVKVQETVTEQLGDFTAQLNALEPAIKSEDDSKGKEKKAKWEKVSAIAKTIAIIKSPADFDAYSRDNRVQLDHFLDGMIGYMSDAYPAYQEFFKDKTPQAKRTAIQGCFQSQEFIDKIRLKLDEALKSKTGLSLHKEKLRHESDIDTAILGLEHGLKSLSEHGNAIPQEALDKIRDEFNNPEADLKLTSVYIQGYLETIISRMVSQELRDAQREVREFDAKGRANASKDMREDIQARFNRLFSTHMAAVIRTIDTINEKRKLIKDLDTSMKDTAKAFERSILDIGGSVMADYIDSKVAGAGERIKKAVGEAKTKDEGLVGDILENVDSAWKKHKTSRHGITTATIDTSQVRTAFQLLRSDSSNLREVMGYVLDNAEITRDQREAMKRLIKDDPENPAVKTMLTSTASLIVRDYIQTGGKLDEAELMAIGKSKEHGWLKDILVTGMQMEPEAEETIRSIYGDEVTKVLREKREWPDLWEWLQDNVTVKGILQILLIALGLWGGVSVLAPGLLGGLPTIQSAASAVGATAINLAGRLPNGEPRINIPLGVPKPSGTH
ncbi:MAG: hypothetical protein NUV52_02295 [Candidatus Roizmanbacteria bacterium]|nr:hypothetical protein [Candidatus Roizmanbacteria bacterium]